MSHQQWLRDKLFDLASEVQEGCIVELGTFQGTGAILLARGARAGCGAQVYTIDDFRYRRGWIGEPYGPKNMEIFKDKARLARVHIILIKKSHHSAARKWNEPIGFLRWDSGDKESFGRDWEDWSQYIIPGGIAMVGDTSEGDLGATKLIPEICATGEFVEEESLGGVTILRRV